MQHWGSYAYVNSLVGWIAKGTRFFHQLLITLKLQCLWKPIGTCIRIHGIAMERGQ